MDVDRFKLAYPNLRFTEYGEKRLTKVLGFLDGHKIAQHPKGQEIIDEFYDRMDYLNNYRGDDDEYIVELHSDFSWMSFSLLWLIKDKETEEYKPWFNGGLIFHGGTNETFSVSLTPQWWGIHT